MKEARELVAICVCVHTYTQTNTHTHTHTHIDTQASGAELKEARELVDECGIHDADLTVRAVHVCVYVCMYRVLPLGYIHA